MRILTKLLYHQKKTKQFWLSIISVGIGLFSLLTIIFIIFDLNSTNSDSDGLFEEHSFIIQKKVTRFTTLGLNSTSFSNEEIENINSEDFILDVGAFSSAEYEVGISDNPGEGIPPFYTKMFLQSIPNRFINKIPLVEWHWDQKSSFVPIILPRDLIIMANYGIGPSMGIPQISEDLIKSIHLKIHLNGSKEKGTVLGKVIGFSDQINSVLVPESFIKYSNKKYMNSQSGQINRLFVKVKQNSTDEFNDFVKDYNLDIADSNFLINNIKSYLYIGLIVVFSMSLLILIMSIFSLIQYGQGIVANVRKEISILKLLGYSVKQINESIVSPVFNMLKITFLTVFVLAIIFKLLIINPFVLNFGIAFQISHLFFGMLFVLLFYISSYLFIKQQIKNAIIKTEE